MLRRFRSFRLFRRWIVKPLLRVELAVALAVLATGALALWEDAILTRSLSVSPIGLNPDDVVAYGDGPNGGTSKALLLSRTPMSWLCSLKRSYEFPYCGAGFLLMSHATRGVDLSSYETMRFRLEHQGPGNLIRIYLKNSDPAYSRPGIPQADKYNTVDTSVVDGSQEITIPFSQLSVAEWWKAQAKISPALAMPDLRNVVAFEIQNGLDGRPGEYRTSLGSVVFERRILSTRDFYTLLALAWLFILTGVLWHNRKQVSKRQQAEAAQLKWASEHDALTNLPNRRSFQSRLQAATIRAMSQGTSLTLFLIDLDHFKHVNDSLGHGAGDELLKGLGERLIKSVRPCDFVARVGGDEFAVILERVEGEPEALARSNEVLEKLLPAVQVAGQMVRPGASIGVAVLPEHADSAGNLFKAADTALFAIKDQGRGGTKLFHREMLDDAERAASQLNAARTAITDDSVVPYYQPKVDLMTGAVVGFEALLRCGSRSTLQSPAAMEEAFKDYELSTKLGDLMQHQVARNVSSWLNNGYDVGVISINASPAEFLRGDYADRLLSVLELYNVPTAAMEVEVTEQVFMGRSAEFVASALLTLREAGVRLALDDFGTGYSSLSHLRDLSIHTVKIDRSFVELVTDNEETAAIVSAIVSLSRTLKLHVIAEGIEKPAQADLLRSLGCPYGQGYLFGGAISGEDVAGMLKKRPLAA